MPGPDQHPTRQINGGTRNGAESADAPGVALLLREHPPLAQPAQDHHRPGPRRRVRRRPDADVGVRPHRRRRGHHASPTSSAPGSACAASSTSPTRGSSARARPRSSCSPATRSTSTRPTPSAWSRKVFPADELADQHARLRPPHRPAADDDGAADQGVGQPDRRQHGLLQRPQRLLHPARAQPLALGPGPRDRYPVGQRRTASPTGRTPRPSSRRVKDQVRAESRRSSPAGSW